MCVERWGQGCVIVYVERWGRDVCVCMLRGRAGMCVCVLRGGAGMSAKDKV